MNPIRLALAELRRLTSSRLARLGVVALALIPTLYGGLYLYANHDPYAALPQVPAAVASDDTGTTLSTGEKLDVGDEVADHLVGSKSFDWHKVSRAEALQGVHDGRYSFAVLLPSTFSADLAATADFTPRRANVVLETNDANNYMTTIMGNTVIKQVSSSVASQVSEKAADRLLIGFNQIHDNLGKAVDGSEKLRAGLVKADDGAAQAATGARSLASGLHDLASGATALHTGAAKALSGAERLHSGATSLASGLGTLESRTRSLPAQSDRLADGAAQVAAGNQKVAAVGQQVAGISTTLQGDLTTQRARLLDELQGAGLDEAQLALVESRLDTIDGLVDTADGRIQSASGDLDRLSAGADQVAAGARQLADATPALTDGISKAATGSRALRDGTATLESGLGTLVAGSAQLQTGAARAASGGDSLAAGVADLRTGLGRLAAGATDLHTQLAKGRDAVPDPTDAQRRAVAATVGDPVDVSSASMAAAGTYGAGLAPLFLSLALWIGAYTLFLLVRPFSTRALATSQRSLRTALGGWLAPVAVGIVQTVALYLVVSMALDIRVAHPVLALLFLGFVSMTFVAILHALAARLGAVGKFLGLVFMVVQLVSAGGTFPWQTLPGPLQAIHHVVPMTYAIDGLRRLMYGADLGPVLGDLGVLAAYLVGALAVSTIAARRSRVWTPSRIRPELSL
ncbi:MULTISPECIES: YhgE/Pip domain-containing protein [unclassified Terrabacter]|uniref:YhgE/Pip domain-containing protein n=1 Tax=unclassified Terrabacter TaxID=2630222 RepID=UPI0006F29F96|nr:MULTISPECIES: YhgE/Pip domain-containing protein [unclassified Terrabacter]KRB48160.1 ABC transporter [Terrabacter sp. Root181]KRF40663.1 ABC transporter [Terrabacter sp. Soil810]